ncbi:MULTISPECIES: hypothetical protein [Acinetobacter]|uniref:hypothetical protein n=1 Tax=Acinetobacter TaxID=469 RepID=UPI0005C6C720|nr:MULTISPECIES: hypothetical protein [Acinetobacter]
MSILENLFYFICLLLIGALIVRVGWKIRYLAPLSFLGTALLVLVILAKSFPSDWEQVQFFSGGKLAPNELALDMLLVVCGAGGLVAFLLSLSVWAIRNDVF